MFADNAMLLILILVVTRLSVLKIARFHSEYFMCISYK